MGFAIAVGLVAVGAGVLAFFLLKPKQAAKAFSSLVPRSVEEAARSVGAAAGLDLRVSVEEATQRLATSIARFETGYRGQGFDLDPAQWLGRARRNNNPGNLKYIRQPAATGADDSGYAIFRTPEDGWAALLADVRAKLTGRSVTGLGPNSTLSAFVHIYAPPEENPTQAYIDFVSRELGISPGTPFSDWVNYA